MLLRNNSNSTGLPQAVERACGRPIPAAKHLEARLLDRPADIEKQIESLKRAGLEALRARWRAVFRKPFPAHLPRHLIIGVLAYQAQAAVSGDLTPAELRYLGADADRERSGRFDPDKSRHQAGTVFVREHAGVLQRAVKTASGFEWKGQEFASLSAVAFAITGTKWNGLRFFGVPAPDRARRG